MNKNITNNNKNWISVKDSLNLNHINRKIDLQNDEINKTLIIENNNSWLPSYEKNESAWYYVYKLINKNKNYFSLFLCLQLIISIINFFSANCPDYEKWARYLVSINFPRINLNNKKINWIIFFSIYVFYPIMASSLLPICKEFIFRKLFKLILKKEYWKTFSNISFVIYHYEKNGLLSIFLAPVSFVLVETYDKTDNIWVPIIIHSLWILIKTFILLFISKKWS